MNRSQPEPNHISTEKVMDALKRAQASASKVRDRLSEPLAVIGIGCRFPGAASADQYWQLLTEGRDCVTPTPADRKQPTTAAGASAEHHRKGAFLEHVEDFDATFFGISGREAAAMDPQQRLLLETTWQALEDAALDPQTLKGSRTGVFVGICSSDYWGRMGANPNGRIDPYWGTGNAHGVAAGRLSYFMDWRGPSSAFDTACSSSLTALHFAARSLRYGDCNLALVAGVNVMLNPELTLSFDQAGMLSPTGACHTFSASADGFVRGEGCGAVLLKRLSKAQADNDRIYCVIRGSAVNQDGKSIGLTAPNGVSQQDVIRRALSDAKVKPNEVGYIEAHGTGTPLGDPIEIGALNAVFNEPSDSASRRDRRNTPAVADGQKPLVIGSVKTNIGHLEGAAGIAGFIKVCLSLQHETIPSHLHFDSPSPHIDWTSNIQIPTESLPWKRSPKPRIAGISSFGFGGTNAHVVIQESPASPKSSSPESAAESTLPTVSGSTDSGASDSAIPAYDHLLTLSAKTTSALQTLARAYADRLDALAPTESLSDFCFTANAGRANFDYRLSVLGNTPEDLSQSLRRWLDSNDDSESLLSGHVASKPELRFLFADHRDQYPNAQVAAFAKVTVFQETLKNCAALFPALKNYSCEQLLGRLGHQPSTSDDVAIHFCTQVALAETWQSWGVAPTEIVAGGTGHYAAACISKVFSVADAAALIMAEVSESVSTSRAPVNIDYQVPELKLTSSNADANADVTSASFWERLASENKIGDAPVRPFSTGGKELCLDLSANRLSSIESTHPAVATILAGLYAAGLELRWKQITPAARRSVSLPFYPLDRKRHWYRDEDFEDNPGPPAVQSSAPPVILGDSILNHPLLGQPLDLATSETVFEVDLSKIDFLKDHLVHGATVLPMAAFLEMAYAAAAESFGTAPAVVDLQIKSPIVLSSNRQTRVQIVVSDSNAGQDRTCRIMGRHADSWQEHALFVLRSEPNHASVVSTPKLTDSPSTTMDVDDIYVRLQKSGIEHGASFQVLEKVQIQDQVGIGQLRAVVDSLEPYHFHPTLLDGCLQVLGGMTTDTDKATWLPVSVQRYQCWPGLSGQRLLTVIAQRISSDGDPQFNLAVQDASGRELACIERLTLKKSPASRTSQNLNPSDSTPQAVSKAVLTEIQSATPDQQRTLIENYLQESIAEIMGLEIDEIPNDTPLDQLGLDSMMAFEMQQELEDTVGIEIGVEQFMQDLTVSGLSGTLLAELRKRATQTNPSEAIGGKQQTQKYIEGAI